MTKHNASETEYRLQSHSTAPVSLPSSATRATTVDTAIRPIPEQRKRRRPLPVHIFLSAAATPVDYGAELCACDQRVSWDSKRSGRDNAGRDLQQQPVDHPDHPDWTHFQTLLTCLMWTTALAVFSALDAKQQCLRAETEALARSMQNGETQWQDNVAEIVALQRHTCTQLWTLVVLPAELGTLIATGIAIAICRTSRFLPNIVQVAKRAMALFACAFIIAIMQTYHVARLMLIPRSLTESRNPYQSLAAVDRYGNVGDNANLYYLTWISEGLALAIFYQVTTCAIRAVRRVRKLTHITWNQPNDVTTLLRATSCEEKKQQTWYTSLYRLRFRTGIWTAAFLACCLIVASSQYIVSQVLWPILTAYQETASDNTQDQAALYWSDFSAYFRVCRSISAVSGMTSTTSLPDQFCSRTVAAWFSGFVGLLLTATAIGMHLAARYCRKHQDDHLVEDIAGEWIHRHKRLPLRTEMMLSILLSLLTGLNAVFSTGVQGPAATVGNLYYASWTAYLLCVRIALGCLEEFYDLEIDENPSQGSLSAFSADQQLESTRLGHIRRYFFLSVFSMACAASAYDAASNSKSELTTSQKYMILAPIVISCQSIGMTCLSLSKPCFHHFNNFTAGGTLSILVFCVWLGNLVLTMHSEDSWAVNGIGEIKMANLYYFSWASILTAGIQMSSFVARCFPKHNDDDLLTVVWIALVKVCFVIFGAAIHIWQHIAGQCSIDDITDLGFTFCARTVFALTLSLTGMAVAGLVSLTRMSCRGRYPRCQAHGEFLIAVFLVFLFGAAVAFITGIGGPGQSVGDLYYSTWLAFGVALSVSGQAYEQVTLTDPAVSVATNADELPRLQDGVYA